MQLAIEVENEKFRVSVGKGFGDFVWLASYAAKLYGNKIYPKGNYLPTLLIVHTADDNKYVPHPRKKILTYFQDKNIKPDQVTIRVTIRKLNHNFTEPQIRWNREAFGADRNKMELRFKYFADKINRKKDFYISVEIQYKMYDEVKHIYDESQYTPIQQIQLKEKRLSDTQSEFEARLVLPLGSIKHSILYYWKDNAAEPYNSAKLDEVHFKQNPKNTFLAEIEPVILSQSEIHELVREDMKIQENISKSLQEKEQESKKKSGNTALCCYTFQGLWSIIAKEYDKELLLSKYEPSTIQRIKVYLEKHLTKLYEVFFYYFIMYNQQKQKKEELVITYQDVMHFLRFYQILKDIPTILNFFSFYNSDGKVKSLSDTIDLNNGIQFPQFVSIILKATQFIQTSNLMSEGETFDQSVAQVVDLIVRTEANDSADVFQFTMYHRNMREQTKLIAFLRESSPQICALFVQKIETSYQGSENNKYYMKKEDIKQLVESCGFEASKTEGGIDAILNDCYAELLGGIRENGKPRMIEDAVFYYDFLQVIQWLALFLVDSSKDEEELEDGDEEIMLLIEKIQFFLNKLTEKIM